MKISNNQNTINMKKTSLMKTRVKENILDFFM